MNIEELRELALTLNGSHDDVKWEHNLTLMVKEKIFLVAGLDQDPTPASFKVEKEDFQEWASRDGFKQAPYLAKGQWVRCEDISMLSHKEWEAILKESYRLIVAKLPKYVQKELGAI